MGTSQYQKVLEYWICEARNLAKSRAAYLATQGDDSVFVEPPFIDRSPEDTTKVEDESVLLEEHDGFALNPKKLIKDFQ